MESGYPKKPRFTGLFIFIHGLMETHIIKGTVVRGTGVRFLMKEGFRVLIKKGGAG